MDGKVLSDFKSFTGVSSDDEALFYLKKDNFDTQKAVNRYFSSPNLYKQQQPKQVYKKKTKAPKKKFGRLTDFLSGSKDNPKDKDEYFAGGGPKSGTSIIDPRGNKSGKDLRDDIFNMAKSRMQKGEGGVRRGGQPKEKTPKKQSSSDPWAKLGGGSKLGNTKSDPSFSSGGGSNNFNAKEKPIIKKDPPKLRDVKIVFWKNGFVVDEGEFRSYEDPKNKRLMEQMQKGYMPMEFSKGSKDVDAHIINRKSENYVPPKKVFKAFSDGSKGKSMGGVIVKKKSGGGGGGNYKCDLSKPNTTILVRMCDGTRIKMKFNLTDTVGTIKRVVKMATTVGNDFDLMMSYPKKALSDMSATVQSAKLQNSQIIQKLK